MLCVQSSLFQRTLMELPKFLQEFTFASQPVCYLWGTRIKKKPFVILTDYDILCITAGPFHCDKEAFLLCHSTLLYQREFPHSATQSLHPLTLIMRSYQFYHSIGIFNLMKNLNVLPFFREAFRRYFHY